MTVFEGMFLDTIKFYEDRKIDVFLHGSTLLRILRDKTVNPREDVQHDIEINIGIKAEDFTDQLYKEIAESHAYFNPQQDKLPNPLIFYGTYPKPIDHEDHWGINPGFVLLARYWEGKTTRIEYMGQGHCIVFPKEFFDSFGEVEVLGRTFKAPANPEKYLAYYFGEDWKTEKKGWHWSQTERYKTWEQLEKGGEI